MARKPNKHDISLQSIVAEPDQTNIAGDGIDPVITGNGLDNLIVGHALGETISGLEGNDTIYGGFGADTILGGDGNDVLEGGNEADTLTGGAGTDAFRFANWTESKIEGPDGPASIDTITDFEANETIQFVQYVDSFDQLTITAHGDGTSTVVVDIPDRDDMQIEVIGAVPTEGNFVFG